MLAAVAAGNLPDRVGSVPDHESAGGFGIESIH
jgi:hypothetical protein